jgi:hypothetical protein
MNAQQVPQCKQRRVTYLLTYIMSETRHGYKLLFDCIYCIYVIQWYIESCKMVYIILPENTHQYLFTAADNSPWNIFHSRFAIFRRHFWKLELKLVWLLATSAGHLKYWRYGKTREFRVRLNFEEASCSHSQGSEINSQTQSFDAYRNSFLRVISVIIAIIKYSFKLGKMRFNRPFVFLISEPL